MAKRAKQANFSDSEHSESDGSSSNSSERKPLSKESSGAKLVMKKQPKMIDTIIDAVDNVDDRKGATPMYIKKFILGKYPEMDTQLFKARFKRTFIKAIENHVLVRTKATEHAEGMTGRVKLAAKTKPRKKITSPGSSTAALPSAPGQSSNAAGKKAKRGDVDAKAKKAAPGEAKAKKAPPGEAKAKKAPPGEAKVKKAAARKPSTLNTIKATNDVAERSSEDDDVAERSSKDDDVAERSSEDDDVAERSGEGEEADERSGEGEEADERSGEGEEVNKRSGEGEEAEKSANENEKRASEGEEEEYSASEGEMKNHASESDEESATITSKKSRDAEAKPIRGATSKMTSGQQKSGKIVSRRKAVDEVGELNIAAIVSESQPAPPRPRPARRGKK